MAALARVGLEGRAQLQARVLPHGEGRLLEIARALGTNPLFLLLDEPGAGLNDAESQILLQTLMRIRAEVGCGLLVVDHDMRLIMRLCDRIHVLDHGRSIAEGTPELVRRLPVVREAYLGSTADA
jgi:ABC-type branched-subunit amino acid transport system ATPase component